MVDILYKEAVDIVGLLVPIGLLGAAAYCGLQTIRHSMGGQKHCREAIKHCGNAISHLQEAEIYCHELSSDLKNLAECGKQ